MTGDVRLFDNDGDGSGNDYDDADEDNDNDDYDGESEIVPKVKCLADSGANKTDKVLSSSSQFTFPNAEKSSQFTFPSAEKKDKTIYTNVCDISTKYNLTANHRNKFSILI